MGTALKTKKEILEDIQNRDVLYEMLTPESRAILRKVVPKSAWPYIAPGWDPKTVERYQEAERCPVLLDTTQTRRLFPMTITEGLDLRSIANHYVHGLGIKAKLSKLIPFDQSEIWAMNNAMGYGLSTHHAASEFGLTMTEEKPFPDWVVATFVKVKLARFQKVLSSMSEEKRREFRLDENYENFRVSFPRGKNSGFPIIAPGSDRFMNNIVLAIDAALARAIVKDGRTRERLEKEFLMAYIVFSRYQHSKNAIPMHFNGQDFLSLNFEPRRRIINAGPKPVSMAVAPFWSWWSQMLLQTPEGDQDRASLSHRIRKCTSVIAIDSSRFDLHMGGVKLRQLVGAIWEVTKKLNPELPEHLFDTIMAEIHYDKCVDTGYDNGVIRIAPTEALNSGSRATSPVGSAGSEMCCYTLLGVATNCYDPDKLCQFVLNYDPAAFTGDDSLFLPPDTVLRSRYMDAIPVVNEKLGVDMDEEIPSKYIGIEVYKDHDNRTALLHSCNSFNTLLFPERFRRSALATQLFKMIVITVRDTAQVLDLTAACMREDKILLQVWKKYCADWYDDVAAHFSNHPNASARAFWSTMPEKNNTDIKQISKNFFVDIDEILETLGHGAAFEFNWRILGLNDAPVDDDQSISTTLNDSIEAYISSMSSVKSRSSNRGRTLFGTNPEILRRVTSWFEAPTIDNFVDRLILEAPFVFRTVSTDMGRFFTTKA